MLTTEKQSCVYFDDSTGELTNAGVASLAKHRLGLKTLAELADEPDDPARFFSDPWPCVQFVDVPVRTVKSG